MISRRACISCFRGTMIGSAARGDGKYEGGAVILLIDELLGQCIGQLVYGVGQFDA